MKTIDPTVIDFKKKFDLTDKVIIITGACGLIGRAFCEAVAQFGGQAFADQIAERLDGIADNYLQNENGQNFMRLYNQLRTEKILKFIREKRLANLEKNER